MKKLLLALLAAGAASLGAQTDFLYDNVLYKTLYPKNLQQFLAANPNATLIDVRSPGEYADTSRWGSLNIGRLKNAVNIPIDSLGKDSSLADKYKAGPVILYCSHSQRSRRVSKLLARNGFKQVYNLNGGMSWMNQASEKEFPGKSALIVSALPFKNISGEEAIALVSKTKNLVIIDVRSAAEYEGKDTTEANNMGRIKKAIHVPLQKGKLDLSALQQYKNVPVLLYDANGALSTHAARYLADNGFTQVYNLKGGLYALTGRDKPTLKQRAALLENTPAYVTLNAYEAVELLKKKPLVIDTRSEAEYNNTMQEPWRKLGRIKNAKNIPGEKFREKLAELLPQQDAAILVYGHQEAALCCRLLKENGFKKVYFLEGGMWNLVSSAANCFGFPDIKPFMENYEGLY